MGDYLVIEGLADSFAKELYGTEQLDPWVTSMDKDDLEYSIYVIGEALNTKGFAEVSSYMFGDEIAKQEGYQPVGLSFCAGYAVGFKAVQSFMKKHNKTIYETTRCFLVMKSFLDLAYFNKFGIFVHLNIVQNIN